MPIPHHKLSISPWKRCTNNSQLSKTSYKHPVFPFLMLQCESRRRSGREPVRDRKKKQSKGSDPDRRCAKWRFSRRTFSAVFRAEALTSCSFSTLFYFYVVGITISDRSFVPIATKTRCQTDCVKRRSKKIDNSSYKEFI